MHQQLSQSGKPPLVNQPASIRKKNAWWQALKISRAERKYPYVISEGAVWFGRKTPDQKAFVWINAEEFRDSIAANGSIYRDTDKGTAGGRSVPQAKQRTEKR